MMRFLNDRLMNRRVHARPPHVFIRAFKSI